MNSSTKIHRNKAYNHCILPVLTYGLGTWHLTQEQERKLRSAQRRMERKMLGITWIREQTKVEDILMTIKKKKWS